MFAITDGTYSKEDAVAILLTLLHPEQADEMVEASKFPAEYVQILFKEDLTQYKIGEALYRFVASKLRNNDVKMKKILLEWAATDSCWTGNPPEETAKAMWKVLDVADYHVTTWKLSLNDNKLPYGTHLSETKPFKHLINHMPEDEQDIAYNKFHDTYQLVDAALACTFLVGDKLTLEEHEKVIAPLLKLL